MGLRAMGLRAMRLRAIGCRATGCRVPVSSMTLCTPLSRRRSRRLRVRRDDHESCRDATPPQAIRDAPEAAFAARAQARAWA